MTANMKLHDLAYDLRKYVKLNPLSCVVKQLNSWETFICTTVVQIAAVVR